MAKAHWHGGDAALYPLRQQSSQDVDTSQGVAQPFGLGPIGGIHILLDRHPVKDAIRKSVEREHIGIEALQLGLKRLQHTILMQAESSLPRQTQTNAHGCAVGHGITDGWNKSVQALAHLVPAFPCMDIGAVGQMGLGDEPFQLHGIRCAV